jgi:hypothetical protein
MFFIRSGNYKFYIQFSRLLGLQSFRIPFRIFKKPVAHVRMNRIVNCRTSDGDHSKSDQSSVQSARWSGQNARRVVQKPETLRRHETTLSSRIFQFCITFSLVNGRAVDVLQRLHGLYRRQQLEITGKDDISGPDLCTNSKLQVMPDNAPDNRTIVIEPSPIRAVCKKAVLAVMCAALFVKFLPMFPISRVKEDDFVENTSFTQKILYLYICTALVRFKYYFAWTVADAICNNAGIGYNGVDESGAPKWDKFTNVDIFKFEVSILFVRFFQVIRQIIKSNKINNCNLCVIKMALKFVGTGVTANLNAAHPCFLEIVPNTHSSPTFVNSIFGTNLCTDLCPDQYFPSLSYRTFTPNTQRQSVG